MEHLFEKLTLYGEGDVYPCHMPGHKRRPCGKLPSALSKLDITEIDGFDNLHQPEGILKDLQRHAAELCGAEESFYLVNGSTGGVLSAVSAALPEGGHILMARNCHKSAYHAAYLRRLCITYLFPEVMQAYDIFDAITPEQVRAALERENDIQAVLIVSPTYEGRISDIRGIAEAAHAKGIPLIVDEAHGAHLGWSSAVAENSCRQGADIVIQSVHKTLPALTQTALLHVNGSLIDRERLRRFLHIYQSSSPSYLLMASIDNALQYMEEHAEAALSVFRRRYEELYERLKGCHCLFFLPVDDARQDIGKFFISVKNTTITGKQLYDILLQRYHIQLEMAAESFGLAMFTVNDGQEGYDRMAAALLEIDAKLSRGETETQKRCGAELTRKDTGEQEKTVLFSCPQTGLPFTEGWDRETREVPLAQSIGSCVGEFVNLYPPGIPLLVPGERMTAEMEQKISLWLRQGMDVQGVSEHEGRYFIKIV